MSRIKYAIPIVIVILVAMYIVSIFIGITMSELPILVIIVGGFIVFSIIAALIFVLIQRLKEIKEEEKNDDFSKY